jgi:hypothetical protein
MSGGAGGPLHASGSNHSFPNEPLLRSVYSGSLANLDRSWAGQPDVRHEPQPRPPHLDFTRERHAAREQGINLWRAEARKHARRLLFIKASLETVIGEINRCVL